MDLASGFAARPPFRSPLKPVMTIALSDGYEPREGSMNRKVGEAFIKFSAMHYMSYSMKLLHLMSRVSLRVITPVGISENDWNEEKKRETKACKDWNMEQMIVEDSGDSLI